MKDGNTKEKNLRLRELTEERQASEILSFGVGMRFQTKGKSDVEILSLSNVATAAFRK